MYLSSARCISAPTSSGARLKLSMLKAYTLTYWTPSSRHQWITSIICGNDASGNDAGSSQIRHHQIQSAPAATTRTGPQ